MSTTHAYNPASRKNVTRETDPYTPMKAAPHAGVCPKCHAIRHGHRWVLDPETALAMLRRKEGVDISRCPACRKIADGFPFGMVTLDGAFLAFHRDEILAIVRNEERRAMRVNPMARIMSLAGDGGHLEIETTDEKLAQRIGREVRKACSGDLEYTWSDDVKLLRVHWVREA